MTKKDIYALLDKEIAWCRQNPESANMQEDFKQGFVEGLTQAKRLIRAARFFHEAQR